MAASDVNDIITLGIGAPGSVGGFITLGLSVDEIPGTPSIDIDFGNDGTWAAGDDVTSGVLATPGVQIRRGYSVASSPLQPAVGTMSFSLNNESGTYDDDAGSGLGRNDPTRAQMYFDGTTHDLWRGRINNVAQLPNRPATVGITAVDTLGTAPKRTGFSTALYSSIKTDAAVGHILDALGIAGGLRTLDGGTLTLEQFWLDRNEDPYAKLVALVNAEGPKARLYVDGAGSVNFEANDYRTSTARCTALQETFYGGTTSPLIQRILRYENGADQIVNKASIPWRTLVARTGTPEIVGSTSNVQDTATTAAEGTIPSGVKVGDVCFYIIASNETSTQSWTVATNWTRYSEGLFTPGTTFSSDHAFKRITDRAESGAKFSVTMGESQKYVAICVAVRGLKDVGALTTSGIIDVEAQANSAASANISANVSTTVAKTMLMTLAVFDGAGASFTAPPTGATEVLQGVGAEVTAAISFEVLTATGLQANQYSFSGTHAAAISSQAFDYMDEVTVWNYGKQLVLGNNEAKVITADFALPVSGAIVPVAAEDFVLTAGAVTPALDRTSGSSITLTLTAGAAGCTLDPMVDIPDEDNILGIRLRAIPLEQTATGIAVSDDTTSQTAYEVRGLQSYATINTISQADAQTLADALVADWKDPRPLTVIRVNGDRDTKTLTSVLEREISDRVRVLTTRGGIDITGWVERIDHTIGKRGVAVTDLAIRKTV
tara:strand:- start:3867 stop:6023 length:2157 start_codon:yes stop_codon:yes gene_type:complete